MLHENSQVKLQSLSGHQWTANWEGISQTHLLLLFIVRNAKLKFLPSTIKYFMRKQVSYITKQLRIPLQCEFTFTELVNIRPQLRSCIYEYDGCLLEIKNHTFGNSTVMLTTDINERLI